MVDLEVLLFMFIRSIREGTFDFFITCLESIAHWMFALDHVHYSRWLPVFIEDMIKISRQQDNIKNQVIFESFSKGYFTVRKTKNPFSSIGIDQAHEQNNKIVKVDGGAIGLLENDAALLNWAISSPIISDMLSQSEDHTCRQDDRPKHHEDTNCFEDGFKKDRKAFLNAFLQLGNPFLEEKAELVHISSKHILDKSASESVKVAKPTGKQQYEDFVNECLRTGSKSLYDNIKKNSFPLFRHKNDISTSKTKQKIVSFSSDRKLYANIFVACQAREGDLQNFFAHENHCYPVSLSEYGKLRKCTSKADFLKCLEEIQSSSLEPPEVETKIIDGAAFVNINAPKTSQTFGDYCDIEISGKVSSLSRNVSRLDFVFDRPDSIKGQTRESRGKGVRNSVRKETPIYKKFQEFMRNDDNKTELFKMLSESIIHSDVERCNVIATSADDVAANTTEDLSSLHPCNHEEVDSRLLLHVQDASNKGFKKISVVTVDTDVVAIALYHFFSLNLEELWVEIGVGKHRRWLPVHKYASILKEEV